MKEVLRCDWCLKDDLYKDYHDNEWAVPVYDDNKLFEMLILEGAQAGLSWHTVLKKRENYRLAFDNWNIKKISNYGSDEIELLLNNEGIIRNKLKINSTIQNATAFLLVQKEFGSFYNFIWQFVNHRPIITLRKKMSDIPSKTNESDAMSKALLSRGFKFVGSTICYAYMQATGMVNDHLIYCWKNQSK